MRKIAKDKTLVVYRGFDGETFKRLKTPIGLELRNTIASPDKKTAIQYASFTTEGMPQSEPIVVAIELEYDDVVPIMYKGKPAYIIKKKFVPNERIKVERL